MSMYKKFCSLKLHEEGVGVEIVETSGTTSFVSLNCTLTDKNGRSHRVDLT